MRVFILVFMLFFFISAKSQSILAPGISMFPQSTNLLNNSHLNDSTSTPKWFFSSYKALSTSISFFKGGNASIFSMPIGLQLNRRLNNNFFAFANVKVAPSYISINPSYPGSLNKTNTGKGFQQNSFGLYPAASLGLMYVNDAKTFSISGSISAERNVYQALPYYPENTSKQNTRLLRAR